MTAIMMFPGQGAQTVGMGEELFEAFPQETAFADAILGYSVEELCLRDPDNVLGRTEFTQPALFVVNALTFFQKRRDGGSLPDFCAGHSLGEYNALLAAGAFDFITGLRLVQRRGQLMAAGSGGGGGMAAVVGLSAEKLASTLRESGFEDLDLANFNSPDQIVISGPRQRIDAASEPVLAAGARNYVPLKVGAAFHSRYMKDAAASFRTFLEEFEFRAPNIAVVANATAEPYTSPESVADGLQEQIAAPVRWVETLDFFLRQPEPVFEEVGPGRVLSGLLSKTRQARTAASD